MDQIQIRRQPPHKTLKSAFLKGKRAHTRCVNKRSHKHLRWRYSKQLHHLFTFRSGSSFAREGYRAIAHTHLTGKTPFQKPSRRNDQAQNLAFAHARMQDQGEILHQHTLPGARRGGTTSPLISLPTASSPRSVVLFYFIFLKDQPLFFFFLDPFKHISPSVEAQTRRDMDICKPDSPRSSLSPPSPTVTQLPAAIPSQTAPRPLDAVDSFHSP